MKRCVSSSAAAWSAVHWLGSSVAAASTGADTERLSDAKYSSRPSGRGSAATARAAAARSCSSTPRRLASNGLERLDYRRAVAACPRTRDEVHQLAPPDRRIVTVLGRLVQDGQKTIVEAHWRLVSLGRTLLSPYACVYNALSRYALTIP